MERYSKWTEQQSKGLEVENSMYTHGPDCLELRDHIRKSWNEMTSFFFFRFGTVYQGMRIEMSLTSYLGSFGQVFWSVVSDPYTKGHFTCLSFIFLSNLCTFT